MASFRSTDQISDSAIYTFKFLNVEKFFPTQCFQVLPNNNIRLAFLFIFYDFKYYEKKINLNIIKIKSLVLT
jgi:hypothetical protein